MYQYGHAGTLAGIGLSVAKAELKAPQLGNQNQTLQPEDVVKNGSIRLARKWWSEVGGYVSTHSLRS